MSEQAVSDLCRAVLEHDERATPGEWEYDDENYIFQVENNHWKAIVAEMRGEGDKLPYDANAELIAHYRSACPTIAREYLRLAERLALAEAVCEGVAMYATVETDERLLMLHHKWLIAKDPQGEGKA